MKRLTLLSFGLPFMIWLCPLTSNAQANNPGRAHPDQVMSQLLEEVRMLRQEVRRLSSGTVRAQALLERLRLQQEQVHRLNVDLNKLRADLTSMRSQRAEIRGKLESLQQKYEAGVMDVSELDAAKSILAQIEQREPELANKEIQLSNELTVERGLLEELNRKLDTIEREMQTPIERPKP